METAPERAIRFERCFNFRDLGGYTGRDGRRVRWRRLFRSGTPQHMSDADAAAVAGLGIGLVIDFRGARFPSSGPVLAPGGTRLPLAPTPASDADYERYRRLAPHEALPEVLERYGEQFAAALTAMAQQPEARVLFHCRLGKDRTGVFAALLLKLLGVSDADVTRDYMLTEEAEAACRQFLNQVEAEADTRQEPLVAASPPTHAAIEAVLHRLATRYGSAEAYFTQKGVAPALLRTFIESALEPPDSVGKSRPEESATQPAPSS